MLRALDIAGSTISTEGEGAALHHARAELLYHLRMIAGSGPPGEIHLRHRAGQTDGFAITVEPALVEIIGGSPRGALNGVYWLLEQLGFHWLEPGDRGLTFSAGAAIESGSYTQEPAFARRTLILGQDALHDHWPEWLEWASRNRLNDLFFHDTPPSRLDRRGRLRPVDDAGMVEAGGGWLFERWDAGGPAIARAAAERGMTLQFGGHHLPALLPRDAPGVDPAWFPLRGGQRDVRHNLCVASPGAREALADGARVFFRRFAGAQVYHLWPDDIRGGGWCECDGCRQWGPSAQALIATNIVAEVLAEAVPGAQLSHLAYHDTLEPPGAVQPAANVRLLWAPRERCYAHAIDEPSCRRNRDRYWQPLHRLVAALGSGRTDVFEYYSDAILFKGIGPPHLATLPADARAYRALGATSLQDLMVGNRPWVGLPWHAWWMARCAWDANVDPVDGLSEFCRAAFPSHARTMAAYYLRQEQAAAGLLDLHDFDDHPRRDVLDFCDRPRPTLRLKVRELQAAESAFEECSREVGALAAPRPEGERLHREAAQARYQALVVRHLAARTAGWEAALLRKPALALELAATASDAVAGIDEWDREWAGPSYAVIRDGMRSAMGYFTAQVRRLAGGA